MSQYLIHPKYRPDIDGLRAVAILLVLAFHAFNLHAGFIGVDIFFVISGYLISSIIFNNLEQGRFSLKEFYIRRIKRIFPALLAVLVASALVGWFTLLADEYQVLGKHIFGGAGFVSNLILWSESGYFDRASETKPLLHLWSLGIEEQFYIFWPLLLGFLWKRKGNFLAITFCIALISFLINGIAIHHDPIADFYSPWSRFWELMVGGVLAYLTLHRYDLIRWHPGLQSILGLTLLFLAVILINTHRFYPGTWALLPTLSAFLIISSGPQTWFNKNVLASRPMVWIGLISYPLYLWHWPLLVFPRVVEGAPLTTQVRALAVAMSVVLAWLTYRFIEKPIRFENRLRVAGLVGLMVVMGASGLMLYFSDGAQFREAARQQELNHGDIGHDAFHDYLHQHFFLCTPMNLRQEALVWGDTIRCFQSKESMAPTIALIGDSHAEHLFLGLADSNPNQNVVYYTKSSLPIVKNNDFAHIYDYVASSPSIHTVLMTAAWRYRYKQAKYSRPEDFVAEMDATIKKLRSNHRQVYIIDDVPTFPFDAKKCKYSGRLGSKNLCEAPSSACLRERDYLHLLERVVRLNPGVKIIDLSRYFCDTRDCRMAMNGEILYRDNGHLNIPGSRFVAQQINRDHPEMLQYR